MYIAQSLAVSAALATLASAQILGFNSGSTLANYQGKVESDYEAEFTTAQNLQGAPGTFNSVRLYTMIQAGTTNTPISAFQAAINTNTTMLLGIWCSGTTTIQNELDALSAAISQYGSKFTDLVIGISVGSEDLYRNSVQGIANSAGIGAEPSVILNFIQQTRSALANTPLSSKPIGHVETWNDWGNSSNKAVLDAADFLGTDLYAYYESTKNNDISNAQSLFNSAYSTVQGVAGSKPVWITETGWPSTGPDYGAAKATVSNAQTYWDQVGCSIFGKTNVWWYNLRDSNPANEAKFEITSNLSTTPLFNLTCPTVSKSSGGDGITNSTTSAKPGSTGGASGSTGGATGSNGAAASSTKTGASSTSTKASAASTVRDAGAVFGLTFCVLLGSISFLL